MDPKVWAFTQQRLGELEAQVGQLADELARLKADQRPAPLATEDGKASLSALFADASAWSRHYSTVRMTVTTFLATAALTVIHFRWNEFSVWLLMFVVVLWLTTVGFFAAFTALEYVELAKHRRNKNDLLKLAYPSKHKSEEELAYSYWSALWPGNWTSAKRLKAVDWPTIAILIATVSFLILLFGWASHAPRGG